MKRCARCQVEKSLDDFYRARTSGVSWGHQAYCKECAKAVQREYRERNPDKVREWNKTRMSNPAYRARNRETSKAWQSANYDRYRASVTDAGLRKRYGMGTDELQDLLARQGSACALCGRPIDWKTRHVDHIDTERGPHVRAILCSRCNNGLGFFSDDPALLQKAAEYVAQHFFISQFGPIEGLS